VTVLPPPPNAPIALKDAQLDHLFETAVLARRHSVATGAPESLEGANGS
jgi:hypothetical protein